METIISSIITGSVVIALVSILFKTKSKEIDGKVNKEAFELIQKSNDEKFDVLFEKLEKQEEKLDLIHIDVILVKKGVNVNG